MTKITVGVAVLVLVCALVSAAQTTPEQEASISGIVLNHAGQPIPDATIQVMFVDGATLADVQDPTARMKTTRTDAKGNFALPGLSPGTHVFRITHPQYLPLASGIEAPGAPANWKVKAGLNTALTFTLNSAATVTGRIVDADGDPLSRLRVEVLRPVYRYGRRGLAAVANSPTGDNGDFKITGVPPGRYYVKAAVTAGSGDQRASIPTVKPGEKDIRPFCVFYGGTTELQQALTITVTDGQEFSAGQMTMLDKPYIHVRGKVIGDRAVLAGARVVRLPLEPTLSIAWADGADIQPDGSFDKANLSPGAFTLGVYKRPGVFGWTTVTATDEDMENVLINASASPLTGAVRVHSDDPATATPSPLGLSLTAADGPGVAPNLALFTPENTFTIPLLAPGKYIADLAGLPAGWYIKSIQRNGQDVLDSGFTFSGGGAKLDVLISPKAASIEGVIVDKDGNPLQGKVTLVPDTPNFGHARLYPSATAGADGSFKLSSVTPGRYHICAWEDILDTAHWNTTYTEPFRSSSQAVEVKEGEHARLTLQRISAATMEQTLSRYGY